MIKEALTVWYLFIGGANGVIVPMPYPTEQACIEAAEYVNKKGDEVTNDWSNPHYYNCIPAPRYNSKP